jgi:hypothetical protein
MQCHSPSVSIPYCPLNSDNKQSPSMLLRANTLLTPLLALLLPRRFLSCVGHFSPPHVRLVHPAVYLEPLHIGNSPVAARPCEHLSLHLPGMRHALPS